MYVVAVCIIRQQAKKTNRNGHYYDLLRHVGLSHPVRTETPHLKSRQELEHHLWRWDCVHVDEFYAFIFHGIFNQLLVHQDFTR